MTILTNPACSLWLSERGIAEKPYGTPQCEQFPLPKEAARSASVLRRLIATHEFHFALLHFTDWPLYEPDEMAVLSAVRAGSGEQRPLIDSPGHLFSSVERDLLTGLFSLGCFFHWDMYLYFDDHTTLYGWEGSLLDLWYPDPENLAAAQQVFASHGLQSTFAVKE